MSIHPILLILMDQCLHYWYDQGIFYLGIFM